MTQAALSDDQLLKRLSQSQTMYILDGYDPSYTFLKSTWNKVCTDGLGTTPKDLILLSTLMFEDVVPVKDVDSTIEACNVLTERGYCIRDISKYQPCEEKCGHAIVTKELFDHAKRQWTFLPKKWSMKCSECSKN